MVAALPAFVAHVEPVTAAQLGKSWHAGCPVAPAQLVRIRLRYVGFDGRAHLGALVVNRRVAGQVTSVFRDLYAARFPIRRIVPVSAYGADDDRTAAADDTSGFNCRKAVTTGPASWSMHAYGEAIDVNDVENPYVEGSKVLPPAGRAYLDRSRARPGMAVAGGVLVRAFARVGWGWGASFADYQHFSVNGR
ncbi:MAG: M15 family metallopeptidase [Actinomycetota bacterium]